MTTPPEWVQRSLLASLPAGLPLGFRSSATRGTIAMVLVWIAVVAYGAQLLAQLSCWRSRSRQASCWCS